MPRLWELLGERIGGFINYLPAVILVIVGILILRYVILVRRDTSPLTYICLVVIALLYAYGIRTIKLASEKMHFIEYGLLSYFVFRALRNDIKKRSIYLWTSLIVFLIGFMDEVTQWILPNRFYDTRDVVMNCVAGLLGLAVIAFVVKARIT